MAGNGLNPQSQKAQFPKVQHDLGYAPRKENPDRGVTNGAVRKGIHQTGHHAIDGGPIGDGWSFQTRAEGDSGNMQEQIGRATKRRVNDHRIMDGIIGQDVSANKPLTGHGHHGVGGLCRQIQPNGLPRGSQGGVGNGHTHCFGDHLAGGGGPQKLTATPRGSTRPTAHFGGLFKGD